ncbi:MAG: hypothetical protein Ct9H90mP13_11920 [Pseudomonadota bacterium]|nr:MAG: hypothetical protein Ct9H90mP13_11920 [Pseudomonadota bacterium]
MGIWESTQANIPSDWPYDEFMYEIEGQILMTDQDGNTYEINPGEGIIVPQDGKEISQYLRVFQRFGLFMIQAKFSLVRPSL